MSAITLSPQQWADRIRLRLASTVESIVAVGVDLAAAKSQLGGRFTAMVERDLGMSERTAQRFMAIARHEVLANPTHGSALPPSYRTLYELSRVEPTLLERAIADHVVTPEMERSAAEELVNQYKPRTTRTVTTTTAVEVTFDPSTGEYLEGDAREAREVADGVAAPSVDRGAGVASSGDGEDSGRGGPRTTPSAGNSAPAPVPSRTLLDAWHAEIASATGRLITFDAEQLAAVLSIDEAGAAVASVRQIRGWCDRIEKALSKRNLKAV